MERVKNIYEMEGIGLDIRLRLSVWVGGGSMRLLIGSRLKDQFMRSKKERLKTRFRLYLFILLGIGFLILKIEPMGRGLYLNEKVMYTYIGDKIGLLILGSLLIWVGIRLTKVELGSFGGMVMEYEYILRGWFGSVGIYLILNTNDIRRFYICMESVSLVRYMMASYIRESGYATEAGIKYYRLGCRASGLIRYGLSLLYGTLGTFNFGEIYIRMDFNLGLDFSSWLISMYEFVGWEIRRLGLRIKRGRSPFHIWMVDVYEGVPRSTVFYYAILPKRGLIILRSRFIILSGFNLDSINLNIERFFILGLFSIRLGGRGGRGQIRLKAFMVYSSVSHIGWMRSGLSTKTLEGVEGIRFYLVVYTIMSILFWKRILLIKVEDEAGNQRDIKYRTDLGNLGKDNPVIGFIFIFRLLSIAGIPPLAGFGSKIIVLVSLVEQNIYIYSVSLLRVSGFSLYNYIRRIKIIYFENMESKGTSLVILMNKPMSIRVGSRILFVVFLFINPGAFILIIHKIALGLVCV